MAEALGADYPHFAPVIYTTLGLGHAHAALGRPADARRLYAAARAGYAALDDAFMVDYSLWVELLLVVLPYATDATAERAALGAEAGHAWEGARGRMTNATHAAPADLLLALLGGRWVEAQRLAEASRANPAVNYAQGATVALATLARWAGEADRARDLLHALHPAGPDTEPGDCYFPHGIAALALAGELALDADDPATAERWLAAHGRWLDWSGAVLWRADHLLLRARRARVSGDPSTARMHAAAALAAASVPRQPLVLLATRRLLGELATAGAQHQDAAAHLAAALALAEACAAPYERALTLLSLAELRVATADLAVAAATLAEARAILTSLAAAPALTRAEALAARLASAPAPPPAARPFGLTAREAEVLRLVAEGLTDAQIAARLSIGRSTVNTHLKAVYGKLGVNTRAGATRVALDHGLRSPAPPIIS